MRINYSGRFSVSDPTTCTDFITTGYDAAVLADEFNKSYNGSPYTRYDGDDLDVYKRQIKDTENQSLDLFCFAKFYQLTYL